MYDTLLVLHLLSATAMIAAVVYFTAITLGAPVIAAHYKLATAAVQGGAVLLLVFGVWLTFHIDGYELWDPWILGSLVLWVVTAIAGARIGATVNAQLATGEPVSIAGKELLHWVSVAGTVAILVLMIFKPGA